MNLFFKRHCTSLAHPPTPSQLIQLFKSGHLSDSIKLLNSINSSGHIQNVFSKPILFANIVHSCTRSRHFAAGVQLHCHLLKSGLETAAFVDNSLLTLYYKLGSDFNDTRRFFDGLPSKDVVSWTAMISGYIRAGRSNEAIELYLEMLEFGVEPNEFTLSAVMKACSEINGFGLGKCLHGVVVKCGFECYEEIASALIYMYGRNREQRNCRKVFDEMPEPDLVCVPL